MHNGLLELSQFGINKNIRIIVGLSNNISLLC